MDLLVSLSDLFMYLSLEFFGTRSYTFPLILRLADYALVSFFLNRFSWLLIKKKKKYTGLGCTNGGK